MKNRGNKTSCDPAGIFPFKYVLLILKHQVDMGLDALAGEKRGRKRTLREGMNRNAKFEKKQCFGVPINTFHDSPGTEWHGVTCVFERLKKPRCLEPKSTWVKIPLPDMKWKVRPILP